MSAGIGVLDALSPLALAHEPRRFRSEDTSLPYRSVWGLDLALGEPSSRAAIGAFVDAARNAGRAPAFIPVGAVHRETFEEHGLRLLPIGEEARVDLAGFRLSGGARRNLRQSARHAERAGYRVKLWNPETGLPPTGSDSIGAGDLARLEAVSESWLAGRRELHFGIGWFDRGYLTRCPVAVAVSPTGRYDAFVTLFGGPAEFGVDLMRQRPSIPRGVMDLVFVRLLEGLRDSGAAILNLGLAPLTGSPPRLAGLMRAWARGVHGYDCDGLRRFKDKFRPAWDPRYVAYDRTSALPRIAAVIVGGAGRVAGSGLTTPVPAASPRP